jgi:hypothetical protein
MFDLEEIVWEQIKDRKLGGIYLVQTSGKTLEEDPTYIEVLIGGKSFYAPTCSPFGWTHIINENWLNTYKNEIGVWVCFENGNPAHPTIMGIRMLDGTTPAQNGYPEGAYFKTANYVFEFNDKNNYISISSSNFSFKFDTKNEIATLTNGAGTFIMDKQKGIKFTSQAGGQVIHMTNDGGISLGKETKSTHMGAYADIIIQVLTAMMSLQAGIMELMVSSSTALASAASTSPAAGLAAGFTAISTAIGTMQSQVSSINTQIPKIQSTVVTLE